MSGPIECTKGFKVQFKLLNNDYGGWYSTFVYLIDSKIPVDQHENKMDSVLNKEDPNVYAYGVFGSYHEPCNLKTNSNNGLELSMSDPITLEYDREAQTVTFTSKVFNYSQTGIPKDVRFAVGTVLGYQPHELELKFLSIE